MPIFAYSLLKNDNDKFSFKANIKFYDPFNTRTAELSLRRFGISIIYNCHNFVLIALMLFNFLLNNSELCESNYF